jgi:hypothetical protein
MNELRKLEG